MDEKKPANEFEAAAERAANEGLLSEFWHFLQHNKKWWLLPILIVLLLVGLLMLLSTTAAAPFVYTLF